MNDLPNRVIEAAESQIGSPYVFGAWGEFCTPSNRGRRQRADHPTIKSKCQVLNGSRSNCDGCQWQGDRMFDCRGFTDWCLKQVDIDLYGDGCTTQYNTASNWIERGDIAAMPECVCCVFVAKGSKKEHTGLYLGNGETIECSVGVQRKPLAQKWTHYAIPAGLYTQEEIDEIRGSEPTYRGILRKGSKGEPVRWVQKNLTQFGYDCGAVDGVYGTKTFNAVKAFQQANKLAPDGIVGPKTWAVIEQMSSGGQELYTVQISGLSKDQADMLISQYPQAQYIIGEV